jgi:hypothetical protein
MAMMASISKWFRSSWLRTGGLFTLCLVFASCAAIKPETTEFLSSYQDFEQQSEIDDAIVFKGDPKLHATYDRIIIREVRIETPKKPAGEAKISEEDLARLKSSFERILKEEFGKAFEVVTQRGRNTLELRVAIVEFQPGDPLLYLFGHAPFVGYASAASGLLTGSNFGSGNATIQGELLDSRSRKRVYAMIDRHSGSQLEIIKGMERWGHVENAMRTWSRKTIETIKPAQTRTRVRTGSKR